MTIYFQVQENPNKEWERGSETEATSTRKRVSSDETQEKSSQAKQANTTKKMKLVRRNVQSCKPLCAA